jgi:hypothetical protein
MSLLGPLSLAVTRLDRKQDCATPFPAFELISLLRQAVFANSAADVAPGGRRPGRVTRLTGTSAAGAEPSARSFVLIPDIVPGARRAGILANANDPFTKPYLEAIQKAHSAVPLELQPIVVHDCDELDSAYAAMVREHADAVVVQPSLLVKPTVDLALKYRLPSLWILKSDVQAGCLAYRALRRRAGSPNRSLCGRDPQRSQTG